jgi:HlyD family secretion protein
MKKGPILALIFLGTAAAIGTHSLWKEAVAPWQARVGQIFGLARAEQLLGYLEADTVLVAAPVPGRLATRSVERGVPVAKGAPLFALDRSEIDATAARLSAQISAAEARLANARTGKRPEEQAVTQAQIDEARAAVDLAEKDLDRQRELQKSSAAARSLFDQATAKMAETRARLASLEAQEKVGTLPARPAEIAALEADLAAARAALAETEARRDQMAPSSPSAGTVEDTFYDAGEWVPAGTPVLSLLPEGGLKLRFFLPETQFASLTVGDMVGFTCDGCRQGLTARVIRIASKAEFTPPVIYSTGARAKLVYLVEALPTGTTDMKPGLPVEVTLKDARP